jgi:hypothetical protein
MKIYEIITESRLVSADGYDFADNEYEEFPDEDETPMELSSSADRKVVNAVLFVCDKLKGEGNSRIDLLPFITQVSEKAGKMVNLADLIAVNKQSPEIQAIIDSIDEKSVKFKNTSVKNTDAKKAGMGNSRDLAASTVESMAARASNKRR